MQRLLWILLIILVTVSIPVSAQWNLRQHSARLLETGSIYDVFGDTIRYDDGVINWWYNGLTNFRLATKFTPAAPFHLQRFLVALDSSSTAPINVYVKNDSAGFPGGTPLWSGNLFYTSPYTWMGITLDTTNLPQFFFSTGSNFWVEIRSNGPPFEIYDITPTQPPRSKTWFAPWGGWVNSPGDNFIRVVGEYSAPVVDVGCTSISHGGNFFLLPPYDPIFTAQVRNYGDNPASFSVTCSLFTELGGTSYSFYQALTPANITSLAPGQSQSFSFPPINIPVTNRYRIRARTMLAGDSNPDNNTKDTELQIYTLPAELRYDDTLYTNAAYALTGNGWGLKFNPHQTGNYTISQIRVMAQFSPGDSAARVQVLNDDGPSGAPGTILYQTVATMATGWNAFNVNLANQTGSFYVAYIFEYGENTSALRFDDYPASGQGWIKTGGAWLADPSASDWMMRATITGGTPPPDLNVTMTPIAPPIIIPANGGSFQFNATVQRTQAPQTAFYAWARNRYPNGTYSGNLLGPVNINPPVGVTVTRTRTQVVDAAWLAGVNYYVGYANTVVGYPPIDADSFAWTKLTTSDGGPLVWEVINYGEEFPYMVGGSSTPTSFALIGVFPNPFNPTTVISYELRAASYTSLKVYDTTGRLVATLVNGMREAGTHQVTFDGSGLASGIYLYILQADGNTAAGKLMLVK
jgi:hypothetical protein